MSRASRRRWGILALVLVLSSIVGVGLYRQRRVQAAGNLPSAPAREGEFLVMVRCRGELKASRSVQITAPVNVPELRIVWLAAAGGAIREGEPVVRFDPSSAKQQLQEKEAALNQAQATLDQAVAEANITAEKDKLDLANATYQVERARLEASKKEIVSAIQGEESRIDQGLAEKKLAVEEATVRLHEASDKAKIASLTRARDQALAEVNLTKERLTQMEIAAPLSGVIIYQSNFSQGWVNAKPFKVGDQVWPGSVLAEVPDLNTLELEGKVEEIDRSRIAVANDVRVRIDALPELNLRAKLTSISPLTEQSFEWPPTRSFRGRALVENPDPRLRPAMNGSMDVIVSRLPKVISIPAKALFTRRGKPVVYLVERTGYRLVEIQVLARNPDEVAVSGIGPGVTVALAEPGKAGKKVASS